ncbi:MAG: pseudouridine synthase [Candidatus Paceibacterota bacterium]|jgi:23S rRNA pseudouridine2604 synthase
MDEKIRINKYLALHGIATRRDADKLISAGKVLINGYKAVLGDKISEEDKVEVLGRPSKKLVYYAYNKPRDVITHSPQRGEKDVLTSSKLKGVFPIGRLDKDSEGLLILTNDGRITDRLLNPDHTHEKEYIVKTRVPIKQFHMNVMEGGMELDGIKTKPCEAKLLSEDSFKIILTEGKKHQIRRMCDHLNLPIESLKRVRIMNIKVDGIKSNSYREMVGKELQDFLRLLSL